MDFDVFDYLKKLAGVGTDPSQPASQVQLPQTGPVPMARPDPSTTGSTTPIPMAAAASPAPAPAQASSHPFASLFQKDPTKQDALSTGLLNAGAAMMVAGGPSRMPTNLLAAMGQGIGTGSQAYQGSLKDAREATMDQMKIKAAQQQLDANAAKADVLKSIFANPGAATGASSVPGTQGAGTSSGGASANPMVQQLAAQRADNQDKYNRLMANGATSEAEPYKTAINALDAKMNEVGLAWNGQQYAPIPGYTDALTQKSAAEDSGKTTGDQKEYAQYVDQTQKAGGTPDDFTTWSRGNKQAGATKITNNNGTNNSKFVDKSDEKAADRYDGYATQALTAQQSLSDANTLADLSKNIQFGAGTEWKLKLAPYAQAAGVDIGNMGPAQAWQAIIAREAPSMRPVGSGSTSDKDMALYMASWPQLSNSPEGNDIILQTNKSISEHNIAVGAIANRVQSGEISWQQGDKEIAALPSAFDGFKEFQKNAKKAPAKVMGQSTDAPAANDAGSSQTQVNTPKVSIQTGFTDPDTGYTYLGGDPSKETSWKKKQ